MKKTVIAIAVVLLAAAGVVLPADYFGRVTERTINEWAAGMPYPSDVTVLDYQRGWFSSKARLEYAPMEGIAAMLGPLPEEIRSHLLDIPSLYVDLEIAHGPVFLAIGPGVGLFRAAGTLDLEQIEQIEGIVRPSGPGRFIRVSVGSFSGGRVNYQAEAPEMNLEIGPVALRSEGFAASGVVAVPSSYQDGEISVASVDIAAPAGGGFNGGGGFKLEDGRVRFAYPTGFGGGMMLAPGTTSGSLDRAQILGPNGEAVFSISGVEFEQAVSDNGDGRFSIEASASMDAAQIFGRSINDIVLEQSMDGLTEPFLQSLLPAVSGEFEIDMQALQDFLAGNPALSQNLSLRYENEHEATVSLRISYDGSPALPAQLPADRMLMMGLLMRILDVSVEFDVAAAAAEQWLGPATLGMAMTQGMVEQTDTGYRSRFEMRDGVLTINGKPVPLPIPLG